MALFRNKLRDNEDKMMALFHSMWRDNESCSGFKRQELKERGRMRLGAFLLAF